MSPLEKTEALYAELVSDYADGEKREIRAAAKLLMVALDKIHEFGGHGWEGMVTEYLYILKNDPERFARMMDSNRGMHKRAIN